MFLLVTLHNKHMKFATWNVHKGVTRGGTPNQLAIILHLQIQLPDFVALQEVPSHAWLADVADAVSTPDTPVSHYFAQTHATNGSGIGLLSKHTSTLFTHHFDTTCMSSDTRSVLVARPLYIPNLVVMCTHFSAHVSMAGQTSQATQLAKLVHATTGDVVLMGDLNAHKHSPALRRLRAVGMRDMWLGASTTRGGASTFPTVWPFQRIDYVLVRSDYLLADAAHTSDAQKASDHKCLLVNISGIL